MIILLHRNRREASLWTYFENWNNLQHLIAAYAIILQVQYSPHVSLLLRDSGGANELLDAAEDVLEKGLNRPANIREFLKVLRHVRHNFQRKAPPTPSANTDLATSPSYSTTSHKSQHSHANHPS
jgi:hypothetical protein